MPTRQKRPSKIKQLGISVLLFGFLSYMGLSAVSGNFGTQNRKVMISQIEQLEVKNSNLQIEITNIKKKIALLDPKKLDPDILSERARSMLFMTHVDDRIVILPTQ